jgi:hypothetical protein
MDGYNCDISSHSIRHISADYFLKNSDEGEPLTDAKLEKALEGKTYITYLPVQDKRLEYIEVGTFKNTKS